MKKFKIPTTPFPGWVNVWCGDLQLVAEDIASTHEAIDPFDIIGSSTVATTIKIDTDQGEGVIMVVKPDCDDTTLFHECLHAAWYVLALFGVGINVDNHEALAYMQGYLFGEIKERIKE